MSARPDSWRLLTMLGEAAEALQDNRLRTALSLLGVAIGIASIIVVGSISASGHAIIFKELETFGLRTFWVFRHQQPEDKLQRDPNGSGIRLEDYRDALRIGGPVARISPVVEFDKSQAAASRGDERTRVRLQGVSAEYDVIDGDDLQSGRFLAESDIREHAKVAVIGPAVQQRLFADGTDPLGARIAINNDWFTVVGTLQPKSRDLISSIGASHGEETNARVLVPFTAAQAMVEDKEFVSYLQGQSTSIGESTAAVAAVVQMLSLSHGPSYRYEGESMSTYVDTADRILGTVGLIGIVAASVSLLVGGLAIMNIMTTSVVERTQEIGLRRAIGATKQAIRFQFLAESVLISCTGGVVGIVCGTLLVLVIARLSNHPISPSLFATLSATASTFAVGIVSGFYPAQKAANLAPVEALRHA